MSEYTSPKASQKSGSKPSRRTDCSHITMRNSAELPADLSEPDAPRTTTRASRGAQEAGTSALSRMLTHSRTHLTACHHQRQRAPPETEQERRPHTATWSDHGAHEQRRTAASSLKTPYAQPHPVETAHSNHQMNTVTISSIVSPFLQHPRAYTITSP